MEINIDKKIDNCECPGHYFCTVATTCYDPIVREHICYECWLNYCRKNNITIKYD